MCSRPATASTAFRDSQEPARQQCLPASAKARKRTATRLKVSPPRPAQPVSFERKESRPRRYKVSLPEARTTRAPRLPGPHLYMLDESSLASTRQMRSFLEKIKPEDRVLVIGDTAQHQGVDAGRPFQQMQEAGMRTSQLDQIVRQRKNPELLEAVNHLAKGETVRRASKSSPSKAGLHRLQTPSSASPPLPRTTPQTRNGPSLSPQITAAARKSTGL